MKLGIISSFSELCGNATYSNRLASCFESLGIEVKKINLDQDFLRVKNNSTRKLKEYARMMRNEILSCDAINLHLELGLFGSNTFEQLGLVQEIADSCRTKALLTTIHRTESKPRIYKRIKLHKPISTAREVRISISDVLIWRCFRKSIESLEKNGSKFLVHNNISAGQLSEIADPNRTTVYPITYYPTAEHQSYIKGKGYKNPFAMLNNKTIITVSGFITSNKGHDTVIKALSLLPEEYILCINGASHPRDLSRSWTLEIQRLVKKLGLSERVLFLGALDDQGYESANYYSDIVVFPYKETGLIGSGNLSLSREQGKVIICSDITAFKQNEMLYRQLGHEGRSLKFFDWQNHHELANMIKIHMAEKIGDDAQIKDSIDKPFRINMKDQCLIMLNMMGKSCKL